MALSFPRRVWANWVDAVNDLADKVSGMLRDDGQPQRFKNYASLVVPPTGNAVSAGRPSWNSAEAALEFTANTLQTIQGCIEMPSQWMEQTTVSLSLHVYPNSTASAGKNVVQWITRYRWLQDGSSAPSTFTTSTTNWSLTQGLRIFQRINLGDITATGKLIYSTLQWEITRRPADAVDTYTDSVFLTSLDLLHLRDTNRGSQTPTTKWIS